MEKELFSLFPSFEMIAKYSEKPVQGHFIFQHPEKDSWFRVNKKDVSKRDYALLSALFREIKPEADSDFISGNWLTFLEHNGNPNHSTFLRRTDYKKSESQKRHLCFFRRCYAACFRFSAAVLVDRTQIMRGNG